MAEEIKPLRWQPCAICAGHGCHHCKGYGAFIKFLGHWTAYPIARLDPNWADKKRAALEARAEAVIAAAILKAKYPADLLPPHAQALCPHTDVQETYFGVPECHVLIRQCRKCAAHLPSLVIVQSKTP